jgi:hypothetical protein
MIEHIVNKLGGVSAFGVISICIFFAFFTGMLLWSVFLKKSYLDSMCELPLDREPQSCSGVSSERRILRGDQRRLQSGEPDGGLAQSHLTHGV